MAVSAKLIPRLNLRCQSGSTQQVDETCHDAQLKGWIMWQSM
jgi:hypothetical protein